jgi:long-chain fatty acid transport protein
MNMKSILTITAGGLACAALAPLSARAGGIDLYEIGTPDVGLASAGYSARAQDPSTLFKNPAGMSLLEGTQVQGGLQLLYGNVQFSPGAGTSAPLGNDNGGNSIGLFPGGSFFVTTKVTDQLSAGVGTFSYFGLAENYHDNWVGRYYVQRGALLGTSFMPAASYRVNDWLSVGGGPNIMFGYLKGKAAVNNGPGAQDGQLSLLDQEWGVGGIGGVLVEPVKGTRIGVTYVSQVKLDFTATPAFTTVGPVDTRLHNASPTLDLGMTVPQSVMVGFYQELSPKWAVMGDFGWQKWSQFSEVEVGVESGLTVTKNLQFQDTYHGALGAQYQYSEPWRFSAGVAYDSSAVESANRTVVIPVGQTWRFGLGAEWQATQKLNLGAGYEFLWAGDMWVDQGRDLSDRGHVLGSYNGTYFSFFTLNLTYKF